ncbi:MAG TPA: DoxX family protein [Bacteroidota bacterium]
MNVKTTAYWVTTAFLVFGVLSGGVSELMRRPENVEGIVRLGYPVYLVSIIGFWKVLGSIVLLLPRFPRLKEWAYAGIFFNMTGAAVSHAVCGDAPWHVFATLAFAVLTLASWALRPQSRTLGTLTVSRASG